MKIAAILQRKGGHVVSVGPNDTVLSVTRTMAQHRIGAALVRDADGAMLGIISERDIVRGMAGHGEGTSRLPAERLMTKAVVTVASEALVTEALGLMTSRRIRHLPVEDAGKLLGMVSIGDLVAARIAEAEHEAEELKAYVATAG